MKFVFFNNRLLFLVTVVLIVVGIFIYLNKGKNVSELVKQPSDNPALNLEDEGGLDEEIHPLSIEALRKGEYPGSDIFVEQTLSSGSNYKRYITSYKSEGLKIYGLLTVPNGTSPEGGWPVIIFNHGYISPSIYKTTEKYIAYQDALALAGYTTFKSDYRGHGNSEGNATGGYGSNAYTIDVLNAVSSIKRLKNPENPSTPVDRSGLIVDADRIGMWGHSMGGSITLRSMVATKDIKAGVIWAGVVASYEDMIKNWRRTVPFMLSEREQAFRRPGRQTLIDKYGDTDRNPKFWQSISPIYFIKDISGPLQLHHGTSDNDVPILFSERLNE